MSGNAKAIAIVGGITALGILIYVIWKLNQVSDVVAEISNKLAVRPHSDPNQGATIDVTPEVALAPTNVIPINSEIGSESQCHSQNHSENDIENAPKALETKVLTIYPDSQIHSLHSENPISESLSEWRHSDDFRTVITKEKTYCLTLYQSRAFEKLWEARKNLIPELHQAAILEGIESCSKRLRDVFKSNMEAYRALIARGERKGTFRLAA